MPQGSPCLRRQPLLDVEVSVDGSAPAPPGHGAIEYHDVHAIDQPELRKTFKSFSKMKAWFKEHASKTKGQA